MKKAIFDSHGADSELLGRDGSIVEVGDALTEDEADIDDVGPMWHITFQDGYKTTAFEDELTFLD